MTARTFAVTMGHRAPIVAMLITILTFASMCYSGIPTYQPIPDPNGNFPWPSPGCSSVDLSPDKARVYARKNWPNPEGWDEGYVAFDANTGARVQDYQFGFHVDSAPWSGRVSADNAYLYYTTYYDGAVKKRDVVTGDYAVPPGEPGIPVGSWPDALACDSQRTYLYVGQGSPGTGVIGSIQKIDINDESVYYDSVVGSRTLNGEPGTIVVSPHDDYVYVVTHDTTTETLYKIQTSDCTEAGTLEIGGVGAPGFSLSADGNTAYVPHASANKVHVINTITMQEIDLWDVDNPKGFWVSRDGTHALVTTTQGEIQIFDMDSKSVRQTIVIPGVGSRRPVSWDWDDGASHWDDGLNAVYVPVSVLEGGGVAKLVPRAAMLEYDPITGNLTMDTMGHVLNGFIIQSDANFTRTAVLPPDFTFETNTEDMIASQFGSTLDGTWLFGEGSAQKGRWEWIDHWSFTYTVDGLTGVFTGEICGYLPGDTDLDGDIDAFDIQQILACNSFENGTGWDWECGDFDGDTEVDMVDINLILDSARYGQGGYRISCDALGQLEALFVPEPTTLSLLVMGGLIAIGRRRK